jgi:sodium transport system ATP-binding protein
MIEVKDISRTYQTSKGNLQALQQVSFSVAAGEVLGLLGPNGAGKTTLLRILTGIISPSSGSATLNGFNVSTHPNEVKKSVGFLSGNTKLYGRLNAQEMLEYMGALYDLARIDILRKIEELFALLNIHEFAKQRIESLSTGQVQRVSIARTLMHNPKILILDEPTNGLDIISSRVIIDFIENFATQGKTVIFSSHYMEEAERLCQRIAFLHKGKLMAIDSLENLRRASHMHFVGDIFMHHVDNDGNKML